MIPKISSKKENYIICLKYYKIVTKLILCAADSIYLGNFIYMEEPQSLQLTCKIDVKNVLFTKSHIQMKPYIFLRNKK